MCLSIDLSIDAMDVSGDHQLDVLHSVYKTRLSPDGARVSMPTQQIELGTAATGGRTEEEEEEPSKQMQKQDDSPGKDSEECGR